MLNIVIFFNWNHWMRLHLSAFNHHVGLVSQSLITVGIIAKIDENVWSTFRSFIQFATVQYDSTFSASKQCKLRTFISNNRSYVNRKTNKASWWKAARISFLEELQKAFVGQSTVTTQVKKKAVTSDTETSNKVLFHMQCRLYTK